jgi:hypothetical protein
MNSSSIIKEKAAEVEAIILTPEEEKAAIY